MEVSVSPEGRVIGSDKGMMSSSEASRICRGVSQHERNRYSRETIV